MSVVKKIAVMVMSITILIFIFPTNCCYADEIKSGTMVIYASELNYESKMGKNNLWSWEEGKLNLFSFDSEHSVSRYEIVLDENLCLSSIYCKKDLTISTKGNHKLIVDETYTSAMITCEGSITFKSGVDVRFDGHDGIFANHSIYIDGATIKAVSESQCPLSTFEGKIYLRGNSVITKPSGGKVFKEGDVGCVIVDNEGNSAFELEIGVNDSSTTTAQTTVKKYKNEWINGLWYGDDGKHSYRGILSWKYDSTGIYVQDNLGWYPTSSWLKINGKWYYFTETGYMDYGEYRDGCWLSSSGAWDEKYYGGHWCSDSTGWWYEDSSGWYPQSQYVWIDGNKYWFDSNGYWK